MISVFSEHTSPRLTYVLDFCFANKGFEYTVVTSSAEWSKIKSFRINYSHLPVPCDYLVKPHDILFEDKVRDDLKIEWKDETLFIDGMKDELALIFWMLSRYEEYLPSQRDQHDRYMAKNSALVKFGIQKKPMADILVKQIWKKIELDYAIIQNGFQCVPSFDIDIAWAYKNRTLARRLGAGLMKGNLKERIKVNLGKAQDPYDTYAHINEISTKVKRIICFSLLGDWSKYDKNIHWKNENYRSLIRGLNSSGGMGIHPSYESYLKPEQLEKEISRLEQIVGHEIVKSRQHFLRLKLPESYEMLTALGIQRDFTMGYAEEIGFRAGTSFPFTFFNLRTNQTMNLLIFPFAYMDSAMKDNLELSVDQAKEEIKKLTDEVREVGGVLMCIWHNSSINDLGEWKGWRDVLDYNVSLVESDDAENSAFDDDFI